MNRPAGRGLNYRLGGWAKASTLVTAIGWFIQLWVAARGGTDTSLAAFLDLFVVFLFAIIPMAFGIVFSLRSQKAGDIAFSAAMIAQGIGPVVLPRIF